MLAKPPNDQGPISAELPTLVIIHTKHFICDATHLSTQLAVAYTILETAVSQMFQRLDCGSLCGRKASGASETTGGVSYAAANCNSLLRTSVVS